MTRIELPYDSWLELHEGFYAIPLKELKDEITWKQNYLNIKGKLIAFPRLNMYYGDHPYTYSGIINQACVMPEKVKTISDRLNTAGFENNAVLCNYYRDGNDSISWHSDSEKDMPPGHCISSLSIGDSRTLKIKPKYKGAKYFPLLLKDGDLLIMGGKFQQHYLHQISKESDKNERINLTFRIIRPTK